MESKIFLFDKGIGAQIRLYRKIRGLSQVSLARLMKVSPQQLQKYEMGQNRISASRLKHLSEILNVPAHYLLGEESIQSKRFVRENEVIDNRDLNQLIYNYSLIKSKKLRQLLISNSSIFVDGNY